MAVTASYNSLGFRLLVNGDGTGNSITVGRNGAGTLLVNDGAVAIANGPATIANTDTMEIAGGDGDDVISIDESNGLLPVGELFGGGGNDEIIGGSLADILGGDDGDDRLFGRGGADILSGGAGNDLLVGGLGDDELLGGLDNDHFIWNAGDGNDHFDGGGGADRAEIHGGSGDDEFQINTDAGTVLVDRINPSPATIRLDFNENLELLLGDGNDKVVSLGTLAALVALTIDGQGGNDSIDGGDGADNLRGGGGNDILNGLGGTDTIDGGKGADTLSGGLGDDVLLGGAGDDTVQGGDGNDIAFLGDGNDAFLWNPGDDNDVIEGQGGTDTLNFNTSNVSENVNLLANGARVLLTRDVAAIVTDLNDVERFNINLIGGTDTLHIGDLSATDARLVTVSLASTLGGTMGDGAVDSLFLTGSANSDKVNIAGGAATLDVTGLSTRLNATYGDVGDKFNLATGDGNDRITIEGLAFSNFAITIDSGNGDDVIHSIGDGVYLAGEGNDKVFAGLTNASEILDGGAGVDTLDTRTWNGAYSINMITGATNYSGESFLSFENLITGEGSDTITGTDASNVIRTNGASDNVSAGVGDDIVEGGAGADTLNGGDGIDTLDYASSDAGVAVSLSSLSALGGHAEGDFISGFENLGGSAHEDDLSGDGGANRINGRAGNDMIFGFGGEDFLQGGGGADRIDGGAGNDLIDGGDGADRMIGKSGNDVYLVDNANDVVVETAGNGKDEVRAQANYTLSANIEILKLIGNGLSGTGNGGNNTLIGTGGNDTLAGAGGGDILFGGSGHDLIAGGNNNDVLNGENGNDTLSGASGNDRLVGGFGKDTLTGGGGNDKFQFGQGEFSSNLALADVITDFDQGADRVLLDLIDADSNTIGDQKFRFIGEADFTGNARDLRYDHSGGDTILQGDTNGDGVADLFIRLTGLIDLTNGDFVL